MQNAPKFHEESESEVGERREGESAEAETDLRVRLEGRPRPPRRLRWRSPAASAAGGVASTAAVASATHPTAHHPEALSPQTHRASRGGTRASSLPSPRRPLAETRAVPTRDARRARRGRCISNSCRNVRRADDVRNRRANDRAREREKTNGPIDDVRRFTSRSGA